MYCPVPQTRRPLRRGLILLLLWIALGPAVGAVIMRGCAGTSRVQLQEENVEHKELARRSGGIFKTASNVNIRQLLEPTRTLVALFVAVFVLNALVRRKLGKFDKTELLMGAFCVLLLIGVAFKSKVVGYSARVAVDAFVVPFLGYFIARRLITTEDQYHRFIRAVSYMAAYVIVICFIERLLTTSLVYRLNGPFENSIALSYTVATIFFITVPEFLRRPTEWRSGLLPVLRAAIIYASPIIVFLSWSRGAWVGFAFGLVLFLGSMRKLISRLQFIRMVGISFVFIAAVLVAMQWLPEEMERRASRTSTVYGRLATWALTIQTGLKSPILGIGPENLREILASSRIEFLGASSYPKVHNAYLAMFAEQGLLGTSLYLAMVISLLRLGLRTARTKLDPARRWRGLSLLALMVAYLLPAVFAATLQAPIVFSHFLIYVFAGVLAGRYGARVNVAPASQTRSAIIGSRLPLGVATPKRILPV